LPVRGLATHPAHPGRGRRPRRRVLARGTDRQAIHHALAGLHGHRARGARRARRPARHGPSELRAPAL